jgi:hypothetical protein
MLDSIQMIIQLNPNRHLFLLSSVVNLLHIIIIIIPSSFFFFHNLQEPWKGICFFYFSHNSTFPSENNIGPLERVVLAQYSMSNFDKKLVCLFKGSFYYTSFQLAWIGLLPLSPLLWSHDHLPCNLSPVNQPDAECVYFSPEGESRMFLSNFSAICLQDCTLSQWRRPQSESVNIVLTQICLNSSLLTCVLQISKSQASFLHQAARIAQSV